MDVKIDKDLTITNISKTELDQFRKDLTFPNPAWKSAIQFGRRTFGIPKFIKQYSEITEGIIVPRGYLYRATEITNSINVIEDTTANFSKRLINNNIKLEPIQIPWVESLVSHRQGIGIAPAGSGKTVMALEVIARLGLPTLWLTHRGPLVKQVKKEIEKFIEVGKIGIIGESKKALGDILTIGMVPTLVRNKELIKELKYSFGLILVDECQHVPSSTFLKVICGFSPRFLYGITATPYREDGLDPLMFNYIGPVVTTIKHKDAVDANRIINSSVLVHYTEITATKKLWGANYADLIEYISTNERRNNLIVSDILYEYGLENTCMVLTVTTKHIDILTDIFNSLGITVASPHSKQTNKIRDKQIEGFLSGETKILIVTYGLLAEGFNYKPSSRLFLAAPLKSSSLIVQSTGRIERPLEGKENAIVYDYVDNIKMFKNQFWKRKAAYEQKNMLIRYH